MKTNIQKTITIKTVEDWFCAAPPQGGKQQWKDGFSAKELAKLAIENKSEFDNLIQGVINETGIKKCNSFECEPEASTPLPFSHRGPRKHDLLLRNKNKKVIIAIEAKAHESFGNDKKGSKDKEKRLKWMQETLFPDAKEDSIKNIPYQLLTGISGTLLEATRNNYHECIFLVLFFMRDKETARNMEVLNNVIDKFGGKDGILIRIKEPGEMEEKTIKCWIKKRIIERPIILRS